MKNNTKKLAVSAILSAASVALMYVGCLTPLDYTAIALASAAIVFAVIELNGKYPLMIYLVTSVLSILILPNKSSALMYAMFFGFYPIFKAMFERLHYIVAWILKFSLFNTCLLLLITVTNYILHLDDAEFTMHIVVILLGNVTFLLYDIAFTQMITLYIVKLRAKFKLKNYFD